MKKLIIFIIALACRNSLSACPLCNKEIMDGIYDSRFYPNLLTMLSAFIVLGLVVIILSVMATKRYKKSLSAMASAQPFSPVPLTTAAMVLGIGAGGFMDGILFHQLLQAHEMLSNKVPATTYVGKSINMFWDGIFHFFCMIVVLVGMVLMWKLLRRKDINRSGRLLAGGMIAGWGIFNIVEGIIDHQLLKLHNVVELSSDHDIANYTFLGASVLMLLIGYAMVKSVKSAPSAMSAQHG